MQNGGPDLDNMKSSPTTAPTTPREGDQNLEFNMPNFPPGGENVSRLLKIISDLFVFSLTWLPSYLGNNLSLIFQWMILSFQNESEAILKIKESMQEEAKRFEKGSDGASDFFMP